MMFSTRREYCSGTWKITSGDIRLVEGHCDPGLEPSPPLSSNAQNVFSSNTLELYGTYMPAFTELLGPFTPLRNQSRWLMPTTATFMATAYWSRVAAMDGPGSPHYPGDNSFGTAGCPTCHTTAAGLYYESVSTIVSTRPAVRKSAWLYLIFALQPAMIALAIVAGWFLYDVPVGKGFGLVSILAGMKRESVSALEGPGFSGTLRRPAHLGMAVDNAGGRRGIVTYSVSDRRQLGPGRIVRGLVYS